MTLLSFVKVLLTGGNSMRLEEQLAVYGTVLANESMKKHTTYHIGGNVAYYIYPENEVALVRILEILKENEVPYHVLGRGSNILCSDEDFDGAIINLDKTLNRFYFEEDGRLIAQAGCSIINLSVEAMKRSFSGLEFASGIPGSIGGGLFMNAGAYKSNLSNILESVYVLIDGKIEWFEKSELDYDYRHSIFQSHRDWIILAGCFRLQKGDQMAIRSLMDSRRQRRMSAQPLDMPCAGSVFRNPDIVPAWRLIEELGLRGKQIGGAKISEKHCNFIVNETGNAKEKDVIELIELIQELAKKHYNIELITEVERLVW